MIKLFKKFRLLVIIPSIITIIFVSLSVIPTNYDLYLPATVDDIGEIYTFEGIDTSDVNVSSVSVYSYYNVSVLNYLQSFLNPYAVRNEHNKYVNTSISYGHTSGSIQNNVSLDNSLIAAYRFAGKEIKYTFKGYIVHSVFGLEKSSIELGDIIIKCEGVELKEDVTIASVLASKYGTYEKDGFNYVNIEIGKGYNFTVKRDNEELDIVVKAFGYEDEEGVTPSLGFNFYQKYSLSKKQSNPVFDIDNPNTYGPSAGFVQALFAYDALTGENLTKDLHIIGTGTIDSFGNVGSIGGVKAKVAAAVLDKADIFFVPSSNYDEAYEQYCKYNTNMKLVKIDTLKDAIDYLSNKEVSND